MINKWKCFVWFLMLGWYGMNSLCAQEQKGSHAEPVEQVPLIPRKLLFGNPEKTSPQISPNGTKLAYLAPDDRDVLNVWIKDLVQPGKDKKITSDQKRGIRSFLWQYDQDHILYIQDKDGDENWHLYQTNIETGETKDLTPFEGAKVSPVEYDPRFPEEMLIQMNRRDPSLFDIYRLNLKTGQLELDTENPGGVFAWISDHRLNIRAAQSYTKEGSTLIRVREKKSDPWHELLTIDPDEIGGTIPAFAPDNQSFYLVSSLDGNTARLLRVDAKTGQRTLVVEDPNYDLSSVMINPMTYALEAVGVDRDRFDWIIIDPQLKADFQSLKDQLKGPFTVTSRDLANQNWVVASLSDQRPTHYYLYNRKAKTLSFLFSTQPALERYRLSQMQPIRFQARDGMELHGYLTLPAGKEPRGLPMILLVHGGPWARDSWGFNPSVQWLANRGYAVLQINFRGSTGYGKQYVNAGNREWATKMQTDLLDGKQWAIQRGYADPAKVAIYGGSYGGYAVLAGLAFTPNEFCCGVDIVGPSNLITLLQTLPPYWGPLKAQMDRRLGKLETEQDFLKSRSPLFKADQIRKPLLIAQGANDPRVKQAESDQIVQAMRHNHLPVEYLLFTDEGHGFARPENRLKFSAAAEEFLAKYLGGRQEPPTEDENWKSLER
ncbi:S9 family peptidase [Candidatus Protochlamydia phocaeensis]|uniref:S9 family peptidase n=1 Tax=Candidatus Protochlamydia phocaeensis TaxID=1414722 RepID=UPI000AADAE53|nr:S9 family peptidase [Candidatus Protochlamydia phocaeensis]